MLVTLLTGAGAVIPLGTLSTVMHLIVPRHFRPISAIRGNIDVSERRCHINQSAREEFAPPGGIVILLQKPPPVIIKISRIPDEERATHH